MVLQNLHILYPVQASLHVPWEKYLNEFVTILRRGYPSELKNLLRKEIENKINFEQLIIKTHMEGIDTMSSLLDT